MSLLSILYMTALLIMFATMFLTFIRLVLGPTIMDRAVASDVLAVASVGVTVVLAMRTGRDDVMVLTIMFALVSFLYPVTLGRFSERTVRGQKKDIPTMEQVVAEDRRLADEAQFDIEAEEREAIQAARAKRKIRKEDTP